MTATILIADDHPVLRIALAKLLHTIYPGSEVVEAANGEAALALAQTAHPWLVLMDIEMPRLDGLEATRRLKASCPDTLVVILTVYEDDQHRAEAKQAGADGFVSKSRLMVELVPTLNALNPPPNAPKLNRF